MFNLRPKEHRLNVKTVYSKNLVRFENDLPLRICTILEMNCSPILNLSLLKKRVREPDLHCCRAETTSRFAPRASTFFEMGASDVKPLIYAACKVNSKFDMSVLAFPAR